MTPQHRRRIIEAVVEVWRRGEYPSTGRVNAQMGRKGTEIRSEENAVRKEAMADLGIEVLVRHKVKP